MRYKLFDPLKWRISQDAFATGRHPFLCEEISDEMKPAVVVDIGRNHRVAVPTKYTDNCALAGSRFPNAVRQLLHPEQCFDGNAGRLIQIESALGIGMPLNLAAMVQCHDTLTKF